MRPAALALLAILALAVATRVLQLSTPGRLMFDEFYARDACVYLGWSPAICGLESESTWVHPPLGKWMIAVGIAIAGFGPIGWRLAPALAGVLLVGLVFVLARRLTGSTLAASLAGVVTAVDPLSIVSSRVAMLDVFIACAGVAVVLFVVLDRDRPGHGGSRLTGLFRPWLMAAGVAGGIAVATKWSGVLAVGAGLVLVFAWEASGARRRHRRQSSALLAAARPGIVWLVLLPAAIYLTSYAGRIEGSLMMPPWEQDAWLSQFASRQVSMFEFHQQLDVSHPYSSPPWSWLLGKRAVVYFIEIDAVGRYREVLAFVNPIIWLPAAVAAAACGVAAIRRRRLGGPEFVIAAAVAATYLPWLILAAGRPSVYVYYVLPTIPFLAVALGWAAAQLPVPLRRAFSASVAAIAITAVLFWSPLLYAWPLDYEAWRARIVFTDCDEDWPSGRLTPRRSTGEPPRGWCWV